MLIQSLKLWDDREDVMLTTFLTQPDTFIPNPEKKPAVIVCAGGAYMTCDRHGTEGDPIAMRFASAGYQSFVLEYSIASKAPEGKALFPAQLYDFGKAFITIHEHANEWNIDVNRISIIGFSAGAHLCGMMATHWHTPLLSEYFGVKSDTFKMLTAILVYGLFDYTIQEEHRKNHKIAILPDDLNVPTFGEINPSTEQLKKYSPIFHITENTPPIFLAAARDDGMVPAIHTLRMAEVLHEKGIPYELHVFEYGDHGFSMGQNLIQPYRLDKAHACEKWVEMAKVFLLHHVAPETLACEENPFAQFDEMGMGRD